MKHIRLCTCYISLTHTVVRTCLRSTFTLIITYKTLKREMQSLTAFLICNNVCGILESLLCSTKVMYSLCMLSIIIISSMSSTYTTIGIQIRFTLMNPNFRWKWFIMNIRKTSFWKGWCKKLYNNNFKLSTSCLDKYWCILTLVLPV